MSENKKQEHKSFVSPIMARFSCNEEMAYTIIQSAEKSGELEAIKRMCGLRRKHNNAE